LRRRVFDANDTTMSVDDGPSGGVERKALAAGHEEFRRVPVD